MTHKPPTFSNPHAALRSLVFALMWMILIVPIGPILAHANLVKSEPALGEALTNSPESVVLEFSEALDPGFSEVRLVDGTSNVIVEGPGVVDPDRPTVMTLVLPPLPDGVYSALWKARSTVDGHITYGAVGFSVGASTARASLMPPVGTPDPAAALPDTADTLSRWLSYIALAVAAGGVFFGLLIWRPTTAQSAPDTHAFVTRLLKRLALIGLGGLQIGTLAFALVGAGLASGSPFFELFGVPLVTFLSTRTGLLLEIRAALISVMGALVLWRLPSIESRRSGVWWSLAALSVGVMITFSLQSHAASIESIPGIILDTLHLLAMCTWLGALLPLAILLWASRRGRVTIMPLDGLIRRFSRMAMISVDVLAVSGLFSLATQVQTIEALTETTYGQALIVKVILVAILIALGAFNQFILMPRLAANGDDPGRSLHRTTAFELGIGLMVILAAGILTATPPAATVLDAQRRLGFIETARVDQVRLTLRVAPVQTGDNEFAVDVIDNRPGADAVTPQVLLRMGISGGALGQTQVEAKSTGGGRYTARGAYIALPGQWQIDVILRRNNFDDVVHRFTFDVGTGSAASLSDEDQTPNPIPPDAASIAAGKELYITNCVPCHGVTGKGDGPVGLTLNPRPADLTVHTEPGVHTDGQLFKWISEGYPGTVMPEFEQYLTEEERWNLVNFIRTLAAPQP